MSDFSDYVGGGLEGAGSGAGGGIPGIAAGLISGIVGAAQKHSANKWLKSHPQPLESIPSEVIQNKNLAGQMAGEGLPSEQYNQAMRNIERQQASALRYANDRRGALGSLPYVLDSSNNAIGNLDSENAQARMANQRNLMNVNNQVAGWRDKLFNQNQLQPYLRDREYRMGEQGAGNQNLVGGIDKFASAGLGLIGGFGGGGGYDFNPQRNYATDTTDIRLPSSDTYRQF